MLIPHDADSILIRMLCTAYSMLMAVVEAQLQEQRMLCHAYSLLIQ